MDCFLLLSRVYLFEILSADIVFWGKDMRKGIILFSSASSLIFFCSCFILYMKWLHMHSSMIVCTLLETILSKKTKFIAVYHSVLKLTLQNKIDRSCNKPFNANLVCLKKYFSLKYYFICFNRPKSISEKMFLNWHESFEFWPQFWYFQYSLAF